MSRNKNNNSDGFAMGIGGSSLLVVFAVLCITVFALLSVSSVNADKSLSEKTAAHVSEYYEADCEAEAILASIRQGEVPEGVIKTGDYYSYSCSISDTQELEVEVIVSGTEYSVKRWQTVYTGTWQADDDIKVWDGQE